MSDPTLTVRVQVKDLQKSLAKIDAFGDAQVAKQEKLNKKFIAQEKKFQDKQEALQKKVVAQRIKEHDKWVQNQVKTGVKLGKARDREDAIETKRIKTLANKKAKAAQRAANTADRIRKKSLADAKTVNIRELSAFKATQNEKLAILKLRHRKEVRAAGGNNAKLKALAFKHKKDILVLEKGTHEAQRLLREESLTNAKNSLLRLGAVFSAFWVAKQGLDFVVGTAKAGIEIQNLEASMANLGISTASVDKVHTALGGTLDKLSTRKLVAVGNQLGIPIEKMGELAEIARATANVMGETTEKMFSDIVRGIGRQSPLILDNLGIIIDIKAANSQYAEELGKVSSELTTADKKVAFLNATLRRGKKAIEGIPLEQFGDQIKQIGSAWADVGTIFKGVVAEMLVDVAKFMKNPSTLPFFRLISGGKLDAGEVKGIRGGSVDSKTSQQDKLDSLAKLYKAEANLEQRRLTVLDMQAKHDEVRKKITGPTPVTGGGSGMEGLRRSQQFNTALEMMEEERAERANVIAMMEDGLRKGRPKKPKKTPDPTGKGKKGEKLFGAGPDFAVSPEDMANALIEEMRLAEKDAADGFVSTGPGILTRDFGFLQSGYQGTRPADMGFSEASGLGGDLRGDVLSQNKGLARNKFAQDSRKAAGSAGLFGQLGLGDAPEKFGEEGGMLDGLDLGDKASAFDQAIADSVISPLEIANQSAMNLAASLSEGLAATLLFGGGFKKAANEAANALALEAGGKAIFFGAMSLASLAGGNFASAASYAKAAGMMALVSAGSVGLAVATGGLNDPNAKKKKKKKPKKNKEKADTGFKGGPGKNAAINMFISYNGFRANRTDHEQLMGILNQNFAGATQLNSQQINQPTDQSEFFQ